MSKSYTSKGRIYIPKTVFNENYACHSFSIPEKVGTYQDSYLPVVMVDKGKCSYVQMTRNVQKAGGFFALIINDTPGEVENIRVTDDGTGNDIVITTALISKEQGNIIKNYINEKNQFVYLNIDFFIDKFDTVTLSIYLNVADPEAYSLLKDFTDYYQIIKNFIVFDPVFVTHQIQNLDPDEKKENCVTNGKYCLNANFPNIDEVSGRRLILDSLFHHCFYQIATKYHHPEYFFLFASNYYSECLYKTKYEQFCGSNLLPLYGIQKSEVLDCIYESFGTNREEVENVSMNEDYIDNENSVLYTNYQKFIGNQVKTIPSVFVNIDKMSGRLNAKALFENVCDGFNNKPSFCDDSEYYKEVKPGLTWYQITLIVLSVIVINFIIFMICRKYIIKRIRDKVETEDFDLDGKINTVVNSYLTLRDIKDAQAKVALDK